MVAAAVVATGARLTVGELGCRQAGEGGACGACARDGDQEGGGHRQGGQVGCTAVPADWLQTAGSCQGGADGDRRHEEEESEEARP